MAKKKKNKSAVVPLPLPSNPTVSADSSSSSAPPPIEANPTVSTSSERNSNPEQETLLWLSSSSSLSAGLAKPGLMFAAKLDSEGSDPERNQTAVIVYSDEMKRALSLTEEGYVRVLARNLENKKYDLRFSRYDGVAKKSDEFILHHEWGKVVADNGLKEGYSVAGLGYDDFIGGYFRVLLVFDEDSPPPPPENQEPPQGEADAASIFLFEKKMDGDDLKKPAIECCSDKLKMSLRQTPWRNYIRVFAIDPKGNEHDMSFRRDGISCFTFFNGWEKIVAENGVEEGDLVTGTGRVSNYHISMRLHIFKNVDQSNRIGKAILFFDKKLEPADTDALLGRLLVGTCKDVVKDAVDEKNLEAHEGYVRVSAIDAEWRGYDLRLSRYIPQEGDEGAVYVVDHGWGNVVTANGLRSGDKVWCWGSFDEDGSIQMKIDVDKATLG